MVRRDFEAKAPTGTEILERVDSDAYRSRYELLRDVAMNLVWGNRYAMTMYEKRPTRWRDLPRRLRRRYRTLHDRSRPPRLRDRRCRGRLPAPVPRMLDRNTAHMNAPSDPGKVPLSDRPDAVVGEMNDENGSGCPVAHERAPHPTQGGGNRGLVAGPAQPEDPRQEPRCGQPARRGVQLRRGVQDPRPRRGQARHFETC